MNDLISQFIDFMRSHGIEPSDSRVIVPQSKVTRFHVAGDKPQSENGWFILHVDDHPNGVFGSWKNPGEAIKWKPQIKLDRVLTDEERREFARKRAEREAQAQAELAKEHLRAQTRSLELWSSAKSAQPDHPYLERKGIRPHIARQLGDSLLIPVTKNRQLTGLQFISVDGEKRFKSGTDIKGAYATIGTPSDQVVITEGFATAATIHEATQIPVVIAFNAGNLEPVAIAIRERLPEAKIIIAADNDQWTKGNPGVKAGQNASVAVKGELRIPHFKPGVAGNPTDFNDLAGLYGSSEVESQIVKGKPTFEFQSSPEVRAEDVQYSLAAPFVHMSKGRNQKPLGTIENVAQLLDRLHIEVRYDVIRKDLDIHIPRESFLIDTAKNNKMTRILSYANLAGIPGGKIEEFVSYLGGQNPYNPVVEWINSKPWDGITRLQAFYDTVKMTGESDPAIKKYKETLMKRWMISAIASAFEPNGASTGGVLVFYGRQYLGKTNWFKNLVPHELQLTADSKLLNLQDKDSIRQCLSNWLVELGELDGTFKRSDVIAMKAFLTADNDVLRRPYARSEEQYARRTVFFGSVNEEKFLHDPSGNRRYWTIDCEEINHSHGLDMQQVWAEFHGMYSRGEPWRLSEQELIDLNMKNKEYEVIDPLEERIREEYDWGQTWNDRSMTATQVALELGILNPEKRHTVQIGRVLRDMGCKPIRSNGRSVFRVPQRKTQSFIP